ncbi:MAG: LysR family transcriptional regulator [Chloroflexi bacterium]|nr:LysR family transcriptional regulator [Chloroflexota bacterium]
MNLRHLKYFYWVVKLGSYARASEQLEVSEPGIYRAVQSLERWCGIQLLSKDKGKVSATHAGRVLYDYAEKVDSLEKEAEGSIAELVTPRQGCVVFGTTHPLAYATARHLSAWKLERPDLRLGVVIALRNELHARLLAGELDVALAPTASLPSGLQTHQDVFYDDVLFVAPPNHRLAQRRAVSTQELLREPIITSFAATVVYSMLSEMGEELGAKPNISIQVDHSGVKAELIAAGAGIGLASRYVVAEAIQQGRVSVLNVQGFPYSIPYSFIFRSGVPLSSDSSSLVSYLSSRLKERS